MPARPLNFLWRFTKVPPIEWFIGGVDVVHGTNFVVPPTHRAGTVVSVHDLTQIHYPELADGGSAPYPALIRRAIGRGAWVHTDSEFVRNEVIESFDVDPNRVRTVVPGVPPLPDVAPEIARQMLQRMLPAGRSRYVLAVGTAEPRKDLPGLVRAFDQIAPRHPELHLVLAGPPGWGDDALRDAVASARHGDRVIRTGWVDDLVLAALVREASVLAYPSLYEGFGFPPLQAMSAGVPVVATRAGSLPEVLADAASLVGVGDTDALAQAIEQILEDPQLKDRMRQAGVRRAAAFSWQACGDGLADLYASVASERSG